MRWLAIILLAIILSPSKDAWAASPAPDGTCTTGAAGTACPTTVLQGGGGSSATVSVSTTAAAGCLVIMESNSQNTASVAVSTVAKTSGTGTVGTFVNRDKILGTGAGQFGTSFDGTEVWAAPYTAQLTTAIITVTFASATNAAVIQGMAITGTYNNGCSWDAHAGSTSQFTSVAGVGTITQTTTNADDYLFSVYTQESALAPNLTPTFGAANGAYHGSGAAANSTVWASFLSLATLSVSATQAAITDTSTNTSAAINSYMIADALTSDAPAATGGTYRTLTGVGK